MSEQIVETFDVASLEAFTAGLVGAGFEPVPGTKRRVWRSDIHPAFAPLTDATKMHLVLNDGWPYQPPALLVEGLDTNRSMLNGLVCLWREGDASLNWTTAEGLLARIEEWCKDAQHGWDDDDLGGDAFLNFSAKDRMLATFDLTAFRTALGSWGDFHGIMHREPWRIDLVPGRASEPTHFVGLWFHVDRLRVPPRQLFELRRCLSRTQWKGLERALGKRRVGDLGVPSGGVDLILLCWERSGQLRVLVIACKGVAGAFQGVALQAAPHDEENLMLRAGPDAKVLRGRRVVVFGAGALGGHATVTLAESGVGFVRPVDSEVLTPGNIVRHVAGHDSVGAAKVRAVAAVAQSHAPWTEVECVEASPLKPTDIDSLIADVDVVVDATGSAAATYAIAARARAAARPFVSAALYRGGCIGRLRRCALPDDTPLDQRGDTERYPLIPPDAAEDVVRAEVGCSAPVNNAAPSSVLACASLLANAVIDVLTGRMELDDELIDVYRPLADSPPFDRVGRVGRTSGPLLAR